MILLDVRYQMFKKIAPKFFYNDDFVDFAAILILLTLHITSLLI